MGSQEIKALNFREGWGFIGVYGMPANSLVYGEQRGPSIRAAMTLSFTRTVK